MSIMQAQQAGQTVARTWRGFGPRWLWGERNTLFGAVSASVILGTGEPGRVLGATADRLAAVSALASADNGNVPANTLDDSLATRWSASRWLRITRLFLLGLSALLAAWCPLAQAVQSVTLAWDRSPDATVTGYKVYYTDVAAGTTSSVSIGNVISCSVGNLTQSKTYSFYVVACNSSGVESAPSNVINYTVPSANTVPTISNIVNVTTSLNSATGPIAFTVGDSQTAAGSLTVSGTSSNPILVPNANIVFGGSGASRTVTLTPAFNQTGSATITVTVSDGSLTASRGFTLTVNPDPLTVYLLMEAESATLGSPMAVSADANASGGNYISTSVEETGTATFTLDIPVSGDYVIWCRVLSPDTASYSTYVSVDGDVEDIYDNISTWTNTWQWTVVNGRTAAVSPRIFSLTAGRHSLVFRGREPGTEIDQLLVTTDRNYGPGANTPPTISSIANLSTTQDIPTAPIAFTVGDAQTAAGSLTVSAASSNPTLVPVGNIVFGGSGANRTVTVTPALNQTGTATITVTVNDGSLTASKSFVLTVDPPGPFTPVYLSFEAESGNLVSPMSIGSDSNASGGQFIYPDGNEAGTATFTVNIPVAGTYVVWCRTFSDDLSRDSFYFSADGGTEFIYVTAYNRLATTWQWTAVNAAYDGIDPWTFQFAAGTHTLVFRGREAYTTLDQLLVTNDRNYVPGGGDTAPTISAIADLSTSQGTPTGPIAFTVGDAQTAAGSLIVSAASSNPTLVPVANIVFGGSGANRTVNITPAANLSGTATITVTVSDDSLTISDSFVLTVNAAEPFIPVYIAIEAESATLAAPMAISSDQNASGGKYISSSANESGTAIFTINVSVAGTYVVWCKVFSPDPSVDSFYVCVDGGNELIYGTAFNKWANAWQWTALNAVYDGYDPLIFQFAAGTHTIVFRSRELGTPLDQLLVTNDRSYVPDGMDPL